MARIMLDIAACHCALLSLLAAVLCNMIPCAAQVHMRKEHLKKRNQSQCFERVNKGREGGASDRTWYVYL